MLLEGLCGFGTLIGYLVLCAATAVLLKKLLNIPQEPFRKMLHMIIVLSVFIWLYAFKTWYVSALTAIMFAAAVYPALVFAEGIPGYAKLLNERKSGEIKSSLIVVSLMFSALVTICWGLLGYKYIIVAAVMAWGLGDAAAALIGQNYGKHFIENRFTEGKKTIEGFLAMYVVSLIAILSTMLICDVLPWYLCTLTAFLVAPVCAVVELFTRRGMDTITVPLAAAAAMFALVALFGYWGNIV